MKLKSNILFLGERSVLNVESAVFTTLKFKIIFGLGEKLKAIFVENVACCQSEFLR